MTDLQLYLAIGLPGLAVLVGILVNVTYFVTVNARVQSLENRLDGRIDRLESKMDARFDKLDARFDRLESSLISKFDILTGKVIEIDNRLTRVEEQLKHLR